MSSRPRNTQPPADPGQFSELLHSIYDVTLGRTDWPAVIGQISAASGGHSGLLRLVDCRNASEGFVAAYGYDEHYLKAYREYFVRLDPYREFLAAAPAGALLASDEFAPLSVRDRTEYWNDYERPQDRTHALGSPLGRERDFLLYLGLSRGRRAGPYDEHTLIFLRNLLPHMLRAVQIQRLLGSAVDTRRLSEAALDQLRIGVVLLDAPNSVSFANSAAVVLTTEFGITLSDSGISFPGSRFNDRLQHLISETGMSTIAGRRSAGGDLTFPRPGVGLLQLRVLPFLIDREPGLAGRRIRAAVFLMRPGNAWLDAAQLATQFDLTPAESRLAAMLANGKTVAEAATSLGIAMPTARTHLRAIFGKTGTRRQSELTLHLLTSLAGLTMASGQPEKRS